MINNDRQKGAIRRSIQLGFALQKSHPNIGVLYESFNMPEIVEQLGLEEELGLKSEALVGGVNYALHGHDGSLDIRSYSGILDENTLLRLGQIHTRNNGNNSRNRESGLFGMTVDSKNAARAKGRDTQRERGVGIYGLTDKQVAKRDENSRATTGNFNWNQNGAREYLISLVDSENFVYPESSNQRGHINWKAIAEAVSSEYSHTVSATSVTRAYIRGKK